MVQQPMHTKRSSLAFVVLMLVSMVPLQPNGTVPLPTMLEDTNPLFDGFLVGEAGGPWNETPL